MVVCASHSPLIDRHPTAGAAFLAGVADVARTVRDYDPELVVAFGADHRRAFTSVVPAFTVVTSATGRGDWGTADGAYAVPATDALDLARHLLESGVDVAVGSGVALDHGFGQTITQLFGSLEAVPILPVVINCVVPPRPPMHRVLALAEAVGQCSRRTGRRVLYLGSGGLSHSPPSLGAEVVGLSEQERQALVEEGLREAAARIDPEWDQRFLTLLEAGDLDALRHLGEDDLDVGGVGAHEVRTWVAAVASSGRPVRTLVYEAVPEWITGMALAAGRV